MLILAINTTQNSTRVLCLDLFTSIQYHYIHLGELSLLMDGFDLIAYYLELHLLLFCIPHLLSGSIIGYPFRVARLR